MPKDNIIDFIKKSSNIEDNNKKFFKGFPYIKISKDENGNSLKKDLLNEYAKKSYYIVSIMKNNGINTFIYKYKVPYESFLDFLNEFRINKSYGEILDIERYVPKDLA